MQLILYVRDQFAYVRNHCRRSTSQIYFHCLSDPEPGLYYQRCGQDSFTQIGQWKGCARKFGILENHKLTIYLFFVKLSYVYESFHRPMNADRTYSILVR